LAAFPTLFMLAQVSLVSNISSFLGLHCGDTILAWTPCLESLTLVYNKFTLPAMFNDCRDPPAPPSPSPPPPPPPAPSPPPAPPPPPSPPPTPPAPPPPCPVTVTVKRQMGGLTQSDCEGLALRLTSLFMSGLPFGNGTSAWMCDSTSLTPADGYTTLTAVAVLFDYDTADAFIQEVRCCLS
jgi:hypothetical protein